ncbi:plasmid mobilization relaxosome protein MobC [Lachnospiraceae bacterium MD329]|nr:plasmid mobilization relaxosome protein MobC [Lachnospiraceae bacterium MD329]
MANRARNIQLKIWVNEEERKLIEYKMSLVPTNQIGAYLRKMAIDGYINQIAKRVNSTSSVYHEDIDELRERLQEIWHIQRTILSTLR